MPYLGLRTEKIAEETKNIIREVHHDKEHHNSVIHTMVQFGSKDYDHSIRSSTIYRDDDDNEKKYWEFATTIKREYNCHIRIPRKVIIVVGVFFRTIPKGGEA